MRIIVITNDSTVFLFERAKAEDMFGGRVTEVRNFAHRISEDHDVTFAVITGRYGLVTGDAEMERYGEVPDDGIGYLELQERTDYSGSVREISEHFDRIIIFVPKEMMRILIGNGALKGNVISVTSIEFKDHFESEGWHFMERKGARLGRKNAELIIGSLSSSFPL